MTHNEGNTIGVREFYVAIDALKKELKQDIAVVDGKVDKTNEKVDKVDGKVENINGKIYFLPILIPSAISLFGLFVSIIIVFVRK